MKPQLTQKEGPRFVPAWGRIKAGTPFTTRDLRDEDLTPLKDPIAVRSNGEAADLCAKYDVSLYGGPYECRMDGAGQLWLMHKDWHKRAKMWQYCRDTKADNVRDQFDDRRGGKD